MDWYCAHEHCEQRAGGYEGQHPELCYAHSKLKLRLLSPLEPRQTHRPPETGSRRQRGAASK